MNPNEMPDENRARQQVLRAVMRHLREHGNSSWREIASGVLDGSLTLRDVANSTAYQQQLNAAGQALLAYRDEVGEATFEEEGRRAKTVIEQLNEQSNSDQR